MISDAQIKSQIRVLNKDYRAKNTDTSKVPVPFKPLVADPQVAFIAPLDPFIWDRQIARDVFGFDYVWEVYVPEHKRRWGYYVLPILFGDRLVGRIEPRLERKSGTLRILGIWWEQGIGRKRRGAVDEAVERLRVFLGADRVRWGGR